MFVPKINTGFSNSNLVSLNFCGRMPKKPKNNITKDICKKGKEVVKKNVPDYGDYGRIGEDGMTDDERADFNNQCIDDLVRLS